ncbi:vitamin B6 photo-protection and homoeostasis-domain-containing protein [Aspergillus crustosus]
MNMASNGKTAITFTEVDELNSPTLTYIYSELSTELTTPRREIEKGSKGRVDTLASSVSRPWSIDALRSLLVDVFLPAGYPHSVSEDYVSYQIFDSLQAFSSSIAGLLSSRAVLQGVGVGNADASPTSALLLHILQDTSGRIATILFAHRVGTALEPECKMYRFAADVFNDLAMVLDCLSPMIPAGVSRVSVLSAAGVLRALCGVAGGSSKASLSAHFAKWGNLAEVNAKDSSQETVISLVGMLVGSLAISHINSFKATWLILILLLILHLSLNYAAVRSVQMSTLNRQRANISFSTLISSDPDFAGLISSQDQHAQGISDSINEKEEIRPITIPTPAEIAKQERIFDANGALRWYSSPSLSPSSSLIQGQETLGTCQIGVSLRQFVSDSSSYGQTTIAPGWVKTTLPLNDIIPLFSAEDYILYLTWDPSKIRAKILLKQSSTPKSQLKAWTHALLGARVLSLQAQNGLEHDGPRPILAILSRTLGYLNDSGRFDGWISSLKRAGWDIGDDDAKEDGKGGSGSALETKVGKRVVVSVS